MLLKTTLKIASNKVPILHHLTFMIDKFSYRILLEDYTFFGPLFLHGFKDRNSQEGQFIHSF